MTDVGAAAQAEGAAHTEGAEHAEGSEPEHAEGSEPAVAPVDVDGADAAAGGSEQILPDVVALTAERDEYLHALQRMKADFDNYRKRVARFQEEQSARAASDLVGKLLPVLDNLDLAQAHLGSDAGSEEARALIQARAHLLEVLGKEGLERVDAVDVPFDPTVHDAVAAAGTAGPGETVDDVMRAGYRWRGQVIRPAMVRVRG